MAQRILVIDDEQDIAEAVRDVLGSIEGTEVHTALTFEQGKKRIAEGGWALVVSDERLPDGRGVDLLAEVSRSSVGTLRVLMSAFSDFDVMLRAVNVAHIDHFFLKPADPVEILRWVTRALEEHAHPGIADSVRRGPFGRVGGIPPAQPGHRPPL